jgi:hypothetical protein
MNVPVAFVSLKNLNLSGVDFGNNAMVAFIIQMIRGAPRLQIPETKVSGMQYVSNTSNINCHGCASQYYLNLQASLESDLPSESYSLHLGSNIMGSGQLDSVVFRSFPRSVNELTIIKFVLVCSPC